MVYSIVLNLETAIFYVFWVIIVYISINFLSNFFQNGTSFDCVSREGCNYGGWTNNEREYGGLLSFIYYLSLFMMSLLRMFSVRLCMVI